VKAPSDRSLYEVLEIPRTASPQEVERACDRARALFGPGSLASYTLLAPEEAEALARRIEEARSVLLDPRARAAYDGRLPPEREERPRPSPTPVLARPAVEPEPRAPSAPPTPAPAPFAAPADGRWTGESLRRAREAGGLSPQQMADRTKFQRSWIEAIEEERFDRLPAPVYLRGVLLSVAAVLRLDGQAVARSYLERVSADRLP
jgi:curved DNA-binding protein CbpA